jgi:hypothetical protein
MLNLSCGLKESKALRNIRENASKIMPLEKLQDGSGDEKLT